MSADTLSEYRTDRRRDREPPIEGYPDLTFPQILDRLSKMSEDEAREVRDWEKSHRRRKTLLVRLERRLRGTDDPTRR